MISRAIVTEVFLHTTGVSESCDSLEVLLPASSHNIVKVRIQPPQVLFGGTGRDGTLVVHIAGTCSLVRSLGDSGTVTTPEYWLVK